VVGVEPGPSIEVAERARARVLSRVGAIDLAFLKASLAALPLEAGTIDVAISNHGLPTEGLESVLRELWRVLVPGGELLVSILVAERRGVSVPYSGDLGRSFERAGFVDLRPISSKASGFEGGAALEERLFRAFRLELEDRAEDYGQVAIYDGSLGGHFRFDFDLEHSFEAGRPLRVSKNMADILTGSRYKKHFSVTPPLEHRGAFVHEEPRETGGPMELDQSREGYSGEGFLPGEVEYDLPP
jgi:SAM-dependent methyltransferase